MQPDPTLETILDAVAREAGSGDLRAIEALAPALLEAVARFEAAPDPARLGAVQRAAARAAARLGAMRSGLHAARARMAEIGRLGRGEATYDETGARRLVAVPPPAAPIRR
jgi:hypothetical protein